MDVHIDISLSAISRFEDGEIDKTNNLFGLHNLQPNILAHNFHHNPVITIFIPQATCFITFQIDIANYINPMSCCIIITLRQHRS